MKRLVYYVVALPSLCLGIVIASTKTLAVESKNREIEKVSVSDKIAMPMSSSVLPLSKVWVIEKNQQSQRQSFIWVKNTKKIEQQPFLLIAKDSEKPDKDKPENKPDSTSKPSKKEELEDFNAVIKNTRKQQGLFTIYRTQKDNKIYLEIKPEQLKKNFLATATLESGIGEAGIYSGMPLQDFLFYFERVNDKLNFVVRNVNFRTREGDPQARSLARSFSDSVLYSIDIKSIHPQSKSILIDLSDLLLTDIAGLTSSLGLPGSADESYFGNAKAFPQNVEIESVMNFSGSGDDEDEETQSFITVPDSRGFTLRVHYSLSQLPNNNYQPRLADDRIGYFITAYQDLSNDERKQPFVRYINRWHLEKQDPTASISPPKKPIIFWIDNAVPLEYRSAITEGVLMWNKAFAAAGFKDAIQVKQMPDNAKWDAADIRYNTIRWINTVDGYFAMGPSRVNPLTGEILNATILVDASFVRALKNEYRQIIQPNENEQKNRTSLTALMQNRLLCTNGLEANQNPVKSKLFAKHLSKLAGEYDLCYGMEAANQFAFGSLAMSLLQQTPPTDDQVKNYIHQYLRLIIAHEVGHTLGLRHNFRGSTMLTPEQLNNTEITRNKGLVSSVMDYIPPNLAPKGQKQGDYFPSMVGPYDDWAIQYGYTQFSATTPTAEKPFLNKIAEKSDQPELSYATDEDMYDLDPTADAWDNSNNVLVYSQWQLENARTMWSRLNDRGPVDGDSYSDVREQFGTVLGNYFQNIFYTTKYIGGQSFYRVHPDDKEGKLPFQAVPLEKQRQALALLQKYVFAENAFNFSPDLLNKLAPSRWRHWGSSPRIGRLDYPIHEWVLFMQSLVLWDLLSGDRLDRLKDMEYKNKPENSLSLPELFDTLQNGIWTEVLKPQGKTIEISSLRRGLQRRYVETLNEMVLRKQEVPEDARTLAWYKLKQLSEKLDNVRGGDEYTKAHLLETRDRIKKVLDAPLRGN